MSFKLFDSAMAPANNEKLVRSYHVTSLTSGILGLRAEGFLNITSHRIVFYATGNSFAGRSILQSEVPMADVSGLSIYKGAYFSLMHFFLSLIVSSVVSFVVSPIVGVIISALLYSLKQPSAASVVLFLIAGAAILIARNSPVKQIIKPILAACGALLISSAGLASSANLAINSLSSYSSSLLGRNPGSNTSDTAGTIWTVILACSALLAFLYAFYCYIQYARRETLALAISSKGGSSTPIAISGISGFGLFGGSAIKALTAEPAKDAETIVYELGAVISDIQLMGDRGIEKWRKE